MATVGIQKNRGLVAVESNSVPDWLRVGVVVMFRISYQREPSRPPVLLPTPLAFTWMLWAVHRLATPVSLLAWMRAANRPSSRASNLRVDVAIPRCGTRMGKVV